jgi:hypothetical protein
MERFSWECRQFWQSLSIKNNKLAFRVLMYRHIGWLKILNSGATRAILLFATEMR